MHKFFVPCLVLLVGCATTDQPLVPAELPLDPSIKVYFGQSLCHGEIKPRRAGSAIMTLTLTQDGNVLDQFNSAEHAIILLDRSDKKDGEEFWPAGFINMEHYQNQTQPLRVYWVNDPFLRAISDIGGFKYARLKPRGEIQLVSDSKPVELDMKFVYQIFDETGRPELKSWHCVPQMVVINNIMRVGVEIKQDLDPSETWQPRVFTSDKFHITYTAPLNANDYYQIEFVPKNQSQEKIWPSSYHVNQVLFDKLKEYFKVTEVKPLKLRLWRILPAPIRPESTPGKQA